MNSPVNSAFAALGLLVCAALLLRFALPPGRRQRLDTRLRNAWHWLRNVRHWPARLGREFKLQRRVKHQADEAIERARRKARDAPAVERKGNVYRPDAFKSRPPKDRLH